MGGGPQMTVSPCRFTHASKVQSALTSVFSCKFSFIVYIMGSWLYVLTIDSSVHYLLVMLLILFYCLYKLFIFYFALLAKIKTQSIKKTTSTSLCLKQLTKEGDGKACLAFSFLERQEVKIPAGTLREYVLSC